MKPYWSALVVGLALTAGCYHATITTGLTPSPQVIDEPWAHSFLWGLVPPTTVEAASKCPTGVAQVETQMSFLNMVANFVTGGIYSPMQITVTCAAAHSGGEDAEVVAARGDPQAALQKAAERSRTTHRPVLVQF